MKNKNCFNIHTKNMYFFYKKCIDIVNSMLYIIHKVNQMKGIIKCVKPLMNWQILLPK